MAEPRSVSDLVRDTQVMRRARRAYMKFADAIDDEADKLPSTMALNARKAYRQAVIARRAATAELSDPEPPETPATEPCDVCRVGKCDRCSACTERVLDKYR